MKAKRPAFSCSPTGKACAPTPSARRAAVAGKDYVVLMADMFGVGLWRQAEDASTNCAPACSPCTTILPFTLACGGKAYDALSRRGAKARPRRCREDAGDRLLRRRRLWRSSRRAPARISRRVVVFHVTNPNPVVAGTPCNIKGRVLAIHGSADPVTPKPMMDAFEEELTKAKVDWQVMMFGRRRCIRSAIRPPRGRRRSTTKNCAANPTC